ncbi:hypothetical protein [Candidatus Lokiarchaeum ossiferum]
MSDETLKLELDEAKKFYAELVEEKEKETDEIKQLEKEIAELQAELE